MAQKRGGKWNRTKFLTQLLEKLPSDATSVEMAEFPRQTTFAGLELAV